MNDNYEYDIGYDSNNYINFEECILPNNVSSDVLELLRNLQPSYSIRFTNDDY